MYAEKMFYNKLKQCIFNFIIKEDKLTIIDIKILNILFNNFYLY